MNNVEFKTTPKKCCGCEACVDICSKSAIKMKVDCEGFWYPEVSEDMCVDCGKCIQICPIKNSKSVWNQYEKSVAFAVKHKEEDVISNSRSGGIFTALTDVVLEQSGVIYGCGLTDSFDACHFRTETSVGRDRMRGSKYVQSSMKGIYKQVIQDLKNDRIVLFSGTSCQVQAMRQATSISLQEKLILVDVVCHGVPSPKIWREYLHLMEVKYDGKVTGVDFRNKKTYGWKEHVETVEIDGKPYDSKNYTNMFYNHVSIRPSCFECPYKSVSRPGDITIADFWGINNVAEEFDDDKGVSLVLVNNKKGENFFEKTKNNIIFKQVEIEKCMQPPFRGNYIIPSCRKKFWKLYFSKGLEVAVEIYGTRQKETVQDKVLRKIIKIKNRYKT